MAARLAFSIDLDRCIGCCACSVACSAGNQRSPGAAYVAVEEVVRARDGGLWGSFAHRRCFHCAEAACVEVCPTGALSKWNGLTKVAAERCSGCGYCVDACPFQVPRLRDGEVSKCVGCVEQLEDRQAPWCERTCPSQAIRLGEREAVLAEARARAEALRPRHPGARVYGDAQLGGLGLLLVLLDGPAAYGLPERPEAPAALAAWRELKPAAAGLSGAAALGLGLAFAVARRRHRVEREEGEGGGRAAGAPDAPEGKPGGGGGVP